jgi:nitrite reductase (NADH) small subunit
MAGEASTSTPAAADPASLHRVCGAWDVPRGGVKVVSVGNVEISLFNVGGKIFAYRNACPHAGAPICAGKITGTSPACDVYHYGWGRSGEILRCPWHGWEFDLLTGEHLVANSVRLRRYPVTIRDHAVYLEI